MSFDYESLVQEGLRGVVRTLLQKTANNGLPEQHHFYISLRTSYPGVKVPETVKRANPQEVTIVLQHQFWDLKVFENSFSVMLSFQGVPQQVVAPFHALLSFVDPSTRFGLHFTPPTPASNPEKETAPEVVAKKDISEKNAPPNAKVIQFNTFHRTPPAK